MVLQQNPCGGLSGYFLGGSKHFSLPQRLLQYLGRAGLLSQPLFIIVQVRLHLHGVVLFQFIDLLTRLGQVILQGLDALLH